MRKEIGDFLYDPTLNINLIQKDKLIPDVNINHLKIYIWGKIRQVYLPKNFLSPISLKVREIFVLVNLF